MNDQLPTSTIHQNGSLIVSAMQQGFVFIVIFEYV
jgi:hypothetical protein